MANIKFLLTHLSIGKLLFMVAVIAIAPSLLLAITTSYMPRSSVGISICETGIACYGFPLETRATEEHYDDFSGWDLDVEVTMKESYTTTSFDKISFMYNVFFYYVLSYGILFIAGFLLSRKRTNANPRN